MYNEGDITGILESFHDDVNDQSDKVCTNVKKGNFNFNVDNINTYQSIEYLLNKGATNIVERLLIDRLQDLFKQSKVNYKPSVFTPPADELILPTYVAPVLKTNVITSVTAPSIIPNIYVVGEVIDFTVKGGYSDIDGASTGFIIEPWNNDLIQNVRVGQFLSAQSLITSVPTYTNGVAGGSQYSTLNQLISTVISDDGFNITTSLSDVEIGYGKLEFKSNSAISQGPTPTDSLDNQLTDLVSDPLLDGTLTGANYNTSNLNIISFSATGRFPIYIKSGESEEILTNQSFYFKLNNNDTPVFNYTSSTNYEIKIATEDLNVRGPIKIYDYYTGTDITANAVITTLTKTIETGLEVPYKLYTIPSVNVTSGTLSLKFN